MIALSRRAAMGGIAGLAGAPAILRAATPGPVTVFEAARIVTMEPAQPLARYVAVADGMILGVGQTLSDLAVWTSGREVRHERRFAGKVLLPGLIDPHLHPMQAAVMLNLPFLAPDDWDLPQGRFPGARSPAEWHARFAKMLAASPDNPFICWGWHELFHGPLDRAALDRIAPDRAVVVWQRSFHGIVANTAMLKAWGLDQPEALAAALAAVKGDPAHADLAAGMFTETALSVALGKLRPVILAPNRVRTGMERLQTMLRTHGVTTTSDMATGIFAGFDIEAGLIRGAFSAPRASTRVMLMPIAAQLAPEPDPAAWLETIRKRYAAPNVRVERRVKMFADGAFFAQAMRMNPPGYADGHLGKWLSEPGPLHDQLRRFWTAGFSLHIHVNGDEGLDAVLDGLAMLPPARAQTVTLEHLGYSTEAQNRRIAAMGLMVSAQPNYIRVLGDAYAAQGLGADRASQINRLGSLEAKGVPLGLHSDFNMAPVDPLYLAWIAANRITLGGTVRAPEERLSLAKTLRAITIEAAQVIGMDALVGSIAAGKRADFAVLDRDPFAAGASGLDRLRVEAAVFEGRIAEG
ncbi:MAG: amidohydrolase family protein [Proteobacteria bacterium]|nr:amidohydrolase family protein [Pseudomonadota bacterium]